MISIITVNFKTRAYAERLCASIARVSPRVPFEMFLVENGSGDDLSHLPAMYPWLRVIESATNLGFAGGCNLALQETKEDYVLLLNPDVELTEDAISGIVERMDQDQDVGIGGISLKNADGTQQECVWKFPGILDQLQVLLKLPHVFKHLRAYAAWKMRGFDYGKTQGVDQVMGAFFCIRREVLEAIGLFDDGFFLWYEEVDFARRAARAGWKSRYYADLSAQHYGGSSFEKVSTWEKQTRVRRSLRRYMKKHKGITAWLLFTVLDPFFVFMGFLASIIKPS